MASASVVVPYSDFVDEHHLSVAVAPDQLVGKKLSDRFVSDKRHELDGGFVGQELTGGLNGVWLARCCLNAVFLEASVVVREELNDLFIADPEALDDDVAHLSDGRSLGRPDGSSRLRGA